MNEINYLIIDSEHNIIETGLEMIYTVHQFLRGMQFKSLNIEPALQEYELPIPANGATDQELVLVDYPVHQLKKITIDDDVYYLVCYRLSIGEDTKEG